MSTITKKLTKQEYVELVEKNYGEQSEMLKEILPIQVVCGYGIYGHCQPEENEGEYSIDVIIGDTCD